MGAQHCERGREKEQPVQETCKKIMKEKSKLSKVLVLLMKTRNCL